MANEELTQTSGTNNDAAKALHAELASKGTELTEEQLEEVAGGAGLGWNDGKPRCSCGSTDVEELAPEEINHQTHAMVHWYRCRKCRREFYI